MKVELELTTWVWCPVLSASVPEFGNHFGWQTSLSSLVNSESCDSWRPSLQEGGSECTCLSLLQGFLWSSYFWEMVTELSSGRCVVQNGAWRIYSLSLWDLAPHVFGSLHGFQPVLRFPSFCRYLWTIWEDKK